MGSLSIYHAGENVSKQTALSTARTISMTRQTTMRKSTALANFCVVTAMPAQSVLLTGLKTVGTQVCSNTCYTAGATL